MIEAKLLKIKLSNPEIQISENFAPAHFQTRHHPVQILGCISLGDEVAQLQD
jgi:hypothetical protein